MLHADKLTRRYVNFKWYPGNQCTRNWEKVVSILISMVGPYCHSDHVHHCIEDTTSNLHLTLRQRDGERRRKCTDGVTHQASEREEKTTLNFEELKRKVRRTLKTLEKEDTRQKRPLTFLFDRELYCLWIYPPETQLRSFCLCSGHLILVNFSETSYVTVISLDVLYRAHSGLYRDTKCLEVSPWPLPLLDL